MNAYCLRFNIITIITDRGWGAINQRYRYWAQVVVALVNSTPLTTCYQCIYTPGVMTQLEQPSLATRPRCTDAVLTKPGNEPQLIGLTDKLKSANAWCIFNLQL